MYTLARAVPASMLLCWRSPKLEEIRTFTARHILWLLLNVYETPQPVQPGLTARFPADDDDDHTTYCDVGDRSVIFIFR